MFEAVQSFLELTYHILNGVSFCAFWHFDVDQLINEAVQESNLYIYLIDVEIVVCRYYKKDSKGY